MPAARQRGAYKKARVLVTHSTSQPKTRCLLTREVLLGAGYLSLISSIESNSNECVGGVAGVAATDGPGGADAPKCPATRQGPFWQSSVSPRVKVGQGVSGEVASTQT